MAGDPPEPLIPAPRPVPMFFELFPDSGRTIDPLRGPASEHRDPRRDRPWVFTNMIATLDGATAIDGLSGPLGGPADSLMFKGLRAVPDIIIVGAATAIEERYKPPSPPDEVREARRLRGQAERPLIVVVSRSLSIEPDLPLFSDPTYRPLILTGQNAPSDRRSDLERVAEVMTAGPDAVDLSAGLALLAERGHQLALLEGGPSLNGQFAADGLIDEWNLTISPLIASGSSKRPAQGPDVADLRRLTLSRIWKADDLLFCRWVRTVT